MENANDFLTKLYQENQQFIEKAEAEIEKLKREIEKRIKANEHVQALLNLENDVPIPISTAETQVNDDTIRGDDVRNVVVGILQQEGQPLKVGDLWSKFQRLGYKTGGKKPRSTFGAYLTNTKEMKNPLLFKTADGKWALIEWKSRFTAQSDYLDQKESAPPTDQDQGALSDSDQSNRKEDQPTFFNA